jgi:hypothetical protein
MTTEERVFIEPRDIAAVESECPKCHARIVVPLDAQNMLPERCGNRLCQTALFAENSEDQKRLQYALNELARYASIEKPAVILRFQVKP